MLGRFLEWNLKISLMRQQDSSGNNEMELSGTLPSLLKRSKIDDLHTFARFLNLSVFYPVIFPVERFLSCT